MPAVPRPAYGRLAAAVAAAGTILLTAPEPQLNYDLSLPEPHTRPIAPPRAPEPEPQPVAARPAAAIAAAHRPASRPVTVAPPAPVVAPAAEDAAGLIRYEAEDGRSYGDGCDGGPIDDTHGIRSVDYADGCGQSFPGSDGYAGLTRIDARLMVSRVDAGAGGGYFEIWYGGRIVGKSEHFYPLPGDRRYTGIEVFQTGPVVPKPGREFTVVWHAVHDTVAARVDAVYFAARSVAGLVPVSNAEHWRIGPASTTSPAGVPDPVPGSTGLLP